MPKTQTIVLAAALAFVPAIAGAHTIVISNDDGLTSNTVALYQALKSAGHDVVVSVPCQNQSGMGTALRIDIPSATLAGACRSGVASAGMPSAGPMQRAGIDPRDFYYVDGTPVMAMLYGVDVVGQKRWGRAPDLVLSGPNEGQNVGSVILNSGTVSVTQVAMMNGIPAIAISAGASTADDATLANPASPVIAKRAVELIDSLFARAEGGSVLPAGVGLNVNFPDKLDHLQWRASRIGTYNAYMFRYVEDMAATRSPLLEAMAREHGMTLPKGPGLSVTMNDSKPTAEQQDDESIVYRTAIAVSPMQAGYSAPTLESLSQWLVNGLPAANGVREQKP